MHNGGNEPQRKSSFMHEIFRVDGIKALGKNMLLQLESGFKNKVTPR